MNIESVSALLLSVFSFFFFFFFSGGGYWRGGECTSSRNCERCSNSAEFIQCDETWVRVVACVNLAGEKLRDVFCAETITYRADFAGFYRVSVLL